MSFEPIDYLVRRFQETGRIALAAGLSSLPGKPNTVRGTLEQLRPSAGFRAELAQKSPDEIDNLVKEEQAKESEEHRKREKKAEEEEERKRFYNQPTAHADFEHYCRCAYWTLDEATALSFGKHPAKVNWNTVGPLRNSVFCAEYGRRRDLTLRAKQAGQLFEPVSPNIFLSWASEMGISLPSELTNAAVNSGISLKGLHQLYREEVAQHANDLELCIAVIILLQGRVQDLEIALAESRASKSPPRSALGTRERDTLLLMSVLGAVRYYGFDPTARNKAASLIMNDTDLLGLHISDDTIRNHLKAASEILPADWRKRLSLKPNSDKA